MTIDWTHPDNVRALEAAQAVYYSEWEAEKRIYRCIEAFLAAKPHMPEVDAWQDKLKIVRDALKGIEFMQYGKEGWLLLRTSQKYARGAGSIRLTDDWCRGMVLWNEETQAAIAILDTLINALPKPPTAPKAHNI